jgi:hypothetical protein
MLKTLCKLSTALSLFLALTQGAYAAEPTASLEAQGASVKRDSQLKVLPMQATRSDFNKDGNTDIIGRLKPTGETSIYCLENEGGRVLSVIELPTVSNLDWDIKGIADFNKDGNLDIVWRNKANGINVIWYLSEGGVNVTSFVNPPTVSNLDWDIRGVSDFNKDGNPDILWRNKANGINVIWYMNRDGTNYISFVNPPTVSNLDWNIEGTSDFNKDGNPDIFWRNKVNGINVIWYMNGDGTNYTSYVNPPTFPVNVDLEIKGISDFNKDGNPDLMWISQSGQSYLWLMNGDGSNYISVKNFDYGLGREIIGPR